MNIIVSLVSKNYDVDKIKNIKGIPKYPIFVAGKSESEDKIISLMRSNKYILYDSDDDFNYKYYLNYLSNLSIEDKIIIDLKD